MQTRHRKKMKRPSLLKRFFDVFRCLMTQTERNAAEKILDLWRIIQSPTNHAPHPSPRFLRGSKDWISGAALLARAVMNRPFRQIFGYDGGAGSVNFDKTIHVSAPLEEVYAFWANFENFPKFMTHLKEVRHLKNGRSRWVAAGPGGVSIPWDAEITEQRMNELLAWTSVPGSMVRTAGVVRFDREPDGRTRVQIRMSYCPPAGVFGHAVAWLFGADPKSEMDEDLVRLKSLLEFGKTRAHGAVVSREQVAVASPEQQQQAW